MEGYCNIVQNIVRVAENILSIEDAETVQYQQDGAAPYNCGNEDVLLDQLFYDSWIANNRLYLWPPDLYAMDYSVWEQVNSIVYVDPATTMDEQIFTNNQ